jgi:hypothetical protein
MITAILNLYILSFNKQTLDYEILSLDQDRINPLTSLIENQKSLDEIIISLIEKHLEVSSSFINYKLSDADIINDKLVLSYYCLIPFNIRVKECFTLPINDYAIYSKNLKKIVSAIR